MLVKNILSTLGCNRIFVVADGQDVLTLMKEERVDFVITDWDNKTLNGLDLTLYLRKSLDSVNRMIPIIMLTARNAHRDIQAARDAGITEYIVKPFTSKILLERIYDIVKEPRGFVICKSYIGPDRRRVSSLALPPNPDEDHHYFERKPPIIVNKGILQQLILDDTPRMIMPDYTLKQKIGFDIAPELIINPLTVARSEAEVQKVRNEFLQSMIKDVESLQNAYNILIQSPDNAPQLIKIIESASFSIKSRAGIFGYLRATEVAGQLHTFCRRYYDKYNGQHMIILEKHIQALSTIFVHQITGDGGEIGKQLIIDLARLINKYIHRTD